MAARDNKQKQVGVRELRQNLSVHLDRIKQGERLEVTEHGRPVALLMPLPVGQSWLERMAEEGKVRRATRDLLDLKPIRLPAGSKSTDEVLDEVREDRI